ncbi:MAG: threonylcarbamoyl-AMP synthase [Candidatus Harrisonbacteria bacterium]|nr:threonylcarbamoyl-AMP synthase [Candidatus Harrisonbacteria bacterium]
MKQDIGKILSSGGVGVLPTDTIYGVVGLAMSKKAVVRIYKLRKRNPQKPLIILISSLRDLKLFNIRLNRETKKLLEKLWPGKVSVILPCADKKFKYLHRGTKTLAFRLPKKKDLIRLLKKTGSLVAPSANWEGYPSAKTIIEAKKYFGNKADFYVDAGKLESPPSTLIEIKNGRPILLRRGAWSPFKF